MTTYKCGALRFVIKEARCKWIGDSHLIDADSFPTSSKATQSYVAENFNEDIFEVEMTADFSETYADLGRFQCRLLCHADYCIPLDHRGERDLDLEVDIQRFLLSEASAAFLKMRKATGERHFQDPAGRNLDFTAVRRPLVDEANSEISGVLASPPSSMVDERGLMTISSPL